MCKSHVKNTRIFFFSAITRDDGICYDCSVFEKRAFCEAWVLRHFDA
jgi:hypothetical protein